MGRAQIVSGGPDGRYTILVDVGEDRRDQLVIAAQQNVDQVTAALVTAEARYAAYQAETEALRVVAEADVQAYVDAIAAHGPTSMQAGEAFLKVLKSGSALEGARIKEFPERGNRDYLRVTLKAAQARLTRWQSLVLSDTRQAWCADFTESATGTVATVEVNGESDLILIKPGAPAPTAADGALLSRELMSPEQAFFNAGILPGWQKYKPTFRRGAITALNSALNTASVTLADATSSAQRLNVNQATNLANVPVTYMTCHASAFEVGDNVVVMFDGQDWESPRVIGFITDPRICVTYNLFIMQRAVVNENPVTVLYSSTGIVFQSSSATFHAETASAIAEGSATARFRIDGGSWQAMVLDDTNPGIMLRFLSTDPYEPGYLPFLAVEFNPGGNVHPADDDVIVLHREGPDDEGFLNYNKIIECQVLWNGRVRFTCAFKTTGNSPCQYICSGPALPYALANSYYAYNANPFVYGVLERMNYALAREGSTV